MVPEPISYVPRQVPIPNVQSNHENNHGSNDLGTKPTIETSDFWCKSVVLTINDKSISRCPYR